MKVIDFGQTNSILNQYISEIRNVEVQNDRLRFRRNIERIGEIMAYEMSKEFKYSVKNIQTPLGIAPVSTPDNNLVISTILRAGLPYEVQKTDAAFSSEYPIRLSQRSTGRIKRYRHSFRLHRAEVQKEDSYRSSQRQSLHR